MKNFIVILTTICAVAMVPTKAFSLDDQTEKVIRHQLTPVCKMLRQEAITRNQFLHYAENLYGIEYRNYVFSDPLDQKLVNDSIEVSASFAMLACFDGSLNQNTR